MQSRHVFKREEISPEELQTAKQSYEQKLKGLLMPSSQRRDRAGLVIEMRLSFDQWLDIWLASGELLQIGRRKGQYCMARKDDLGHYEVGNVFIQLTSENSRDAKLGRPSSIKGRVSPTRGMRQSEESNLKRRTAKLALAKKPCPHCAKAFEPAAFGRYHGSRCKLAQASVT